MARLRPDEDALLHSYSDFILTSSLARKSALYDGIPIFQLFIRDVLEAIFRLQHNCHMPEFTDHGLSHICSLVDRISLWTCYDKQTRLTDSIKPNEAAILLLATIIHDMGMLSQNPQDIPSDDPIRFQIGAMPLSEWVRITHVSRLDKLFRRACKEQCDYWDDIKDNYIIKIAIRIAEAHREWPWEENFCHDLPDSEKMNIHAEALAAVIAVSDLLDEDSARCSTTTLLQHKSAPVKSKAHWIRHALTDGRVLVQNGQVTVKMRATSTMDQTFIPFYGLLRNHYKLVTLYNECLKDIGAQIINVNCSPCLGIPREHVSTIGNLNYITELNTPFSLRFHLIDTFFPEARFREKEINNQETFQKLSNIGLEVYDLDWYYKIKGIHEPRTEYEKVFSALWTQGIGSEDTFYDALKYLHDEAQNAHAAGDGFKAAHLSAIALETLCKRIGNKSTQKTETASMIMKIEEIHWCITYALYWMSSSIPIHYCKKVLEYYATQNMSDVGKAINDMLLVLVAILEYNNNDLTSVNKMITTFETAFYSKERLEDETLVLLLVEVLFVHDPSSETWIIMSDRFRKVCPSVTKVESRLKHQAIIVYPWIQQKESKLSSESNNNKLTDVEQMLLKAWEASLNYNVKEQNRLIDKLTTVVSFASPYIQSVLTLNYLIPDLFLKGRYTRWSKISLSLKGSLPEYNNNSFYESFLGSTQRDELSPDCRRLTLFNEMWALRNWNLYDLLHSFYQQAFAAQKVIGDNRHSENIAMIPDAILRLVMSRRFNEKDEQQQKLVIFIDLLPSGSIEQLVSKLLALKPMMHFHVMKVLSMLSDAIPDGQYCAVANWCRKYEETQYPRGAGGDLTWPTFLGPMMQMGSPQEEFFHTIRPIVTRFVKDKTLWQVDRKGFLIAFMVKAPLEMAKNTIDEMLGVDCLKKDEHANGIRWEIIANAVLRRKELSFIREKLTTTVSGEDIKLLNTSYMEKDSAPVDDDAGREHIRSTIRSLLNTIKTRKQGSYSMGGYMSPKIIRRATWPNEENALIKEIVDTLNSGRCLENEAYYLFLYLKIFSEIRDDICDALIDPAKEWMHARPETHDFFEYWPGTVSSGGVVDQPYSGFIQLLSEMVKRSDSVFREDVAQWLVLETMDFPSSLAPEIYHLTYKLGVASNELSVVDMVSIIRGLISDALIEMDNSCNVAERLLNLMAFVLKDDYRCDDKEKINKHLQLLQLLVRKTADHEDPDLRAASARVLLALKHHMGESFSNDFNELLKNLRNDNRKRVIKAIEDYTDK